MGLVLDVPPEKEGPQKPGMPPGLGAPTACPYLSLFLGLLILALRVDPEVEPLQQNPRALLQAEGRNHAAFGRVWVRGCPVSFLKQRLRGPWATRGQKEDRQGTTICWEGAHEALPSLLIHSPFVREEPEIREDKMLLGGCVPPEAVSKLSISLCRPVRSGLVSGFQNFLRWLSLPCQPSFMPGLEAEDV